MSTNNKNLGADEHSANLNWLAVIPEAWAISLQVFLHRKFGERYLGMQAAAVLLLIPIYCGLWPQSDVRPMLMFLVAYFVMTIVARFDLVMCRVRGEVRQHSRYPGYPRLMKLLPFLSELTVKRWVEPLLVFLGGALVLPLSQPLGLYWMIGAACMSGLVNSAVGWDRNRATDMYDSVLDQQDIAESFRKMRGDDF